MTNDQNDRETGARHYPAKTEADAREDISQEAAKNRKPPGAFGLSEPANETNEKTRHSDGQQPRREDSAEGSRATIERELSRQGRDLENNRRDLEKRVREETELPRKGAP